ncbi:hypothetical protein BJ508DRAFT_179626 [Ascobolus immersus RN42]|uniref:Uncharacterized protein n=1 Tax=Ascobolus immersus RN42 TaxID=1160509 RepID=A0A3N4HYE3_ASCIM|nr:hypothetical protein BJ508DRAFT_179626 [Ascobolus immersus RN42]
MFASHQILTYFVRCAEIESAESSLNRSGNVSHENWIVCKGVLAAPHKCNLDGGFLCLFRSGDAGGQAGVKEIVNGIQYLLILHAFFVRIQFTSTSFTIRQNFESPQMPSITTFSAPLSALSASSAQPSPSPTKAGSTKHPTSSEAQHSEFVATRNRRIFFRLYDRPRHRLRLQIKSFSLQ